MIYDIEEVKQLSFWMIDRIAKNKDKALDLEENYNWDWIAAEVWNSYPSMVDEFIINEAIDLILDAIEEEDI